MNQLPAVIIDGILYASWMFIIAVGLTLVYGVMKILNVAHGSLYALGAYALALLIGAVWIWRWVWQMRTRRLRRRNGREAWVASGG